jgi:hypothetical protein
VKFKEAVPSATLNAYAIDCARGVADTLRTYAQIRNRQTREKMR